ncbi:MAG: T9SS type A sorting domain-containing protein, partial [Flavobacteriales bacterium]|nr:T9SS type A sorting domain-containing protein [Flavobacteriales bacterium]
GDHPEQRLIARLFPLDVGVKERSKENGLRVYPNPGNGRIQLQWPGHNAINLEVQDALGRTVYREEALRAPFELDLSHLTAGVYNLLVTARDGRRASAKWIKQ